MATEEKQTKNGTPEKTEEQVEPVDQVAEMQEATLETIETPEVVTDEVDEELITTEEDFETFNHECPDGSIFDREDLAIDWCKMRKMNIGEIKRIKK